MNFSNHLFNKTLVSLDKDIKHLNEKLTNANTCNTWSNVSEIGQASANLHNIVYKPKLKTNLVSTKYNLV